MDDSGLTVIGLEFIRGQFSKKWMMTVAVLNWQINISVM